MTTLSITSTTDYRTAPNSNLVNGQNITALTFFTFGSTGAVTARFLGSQFGGANMSNSVQINGRTDAFDQIDVTSISGAFSALGWTFLSWGASSRVVLQGASDNNQITGSAVDDTIYGHGGDDTVRGFGGGDFLDGGAGDDTFQYFSSGEAANGEVVQGGDGVDTIDKINAGDLDITGLTLSSVERLLIESGTFTVRGDQIGVGSPGRITVVAGSAGQDALTVRVDEGSRFVDLGIVTFNGWTSGADIIDVIGTSGNDVIFGSTQADGLIGNAGDDFIAGDSRIVGALTEGSGVVNRAANANNGSIANAISINAAWSLASDADIAASTRVHHVTVNAAGDSLGIRHYYSLSLQDGQVALFDIDNAGFDSVLTLYNSAGQVVARSDDASNLFGAGGSVNASSSFLAFEAQITGAYTIEVARYGVGNLVAGTLTTNPIANGEAYELNVSTLFNRPAAAPGESGPDALIGGDGSDTLIGGHGDDDLFGGAGPDVLLAGIGDDLIRFQNGDAVGDVIDGGAGVDTLSISGTADFTSGGGFPLITGVERVLLSGAATAIFYGQHFGAGRIAPNATIAASGSQVASLQIEVGPSGGFYGDQLVFDASWGAEDRVIITALGSTGGDVIGTIRDDSITGGLSGDRLSGADGNDTILGGDGNDEIWGGEGNDSITGGAGDDTIRGGLEGGFGKSNLFSDTIFGDSGNDLIFGSTLADILVGGDGNDTLHSMGYDDTMIGGAGADRFVGGVGGAMADFSASGVRVIVNFATGEGFEGDAEGDRYVDMHGAIGSGFNDILVGGDGIDRLFGNAGADLIYGNLGIDTLYGDAGADTLLGEDGADLLWGGDGNDLLYGWVGADTLLGDEGNDTLLGEQDSDILYGWLGNDVLWGGDGSDIIWGEQDNDTLLGETGDDVLLGVDGDDVMYGWIGNDTLYGWDGADVLWGEDGNDVLLGEAGNDTFIGGLGNDTMTGGEGADRFFTANFEMAAGEIDLITAYGGADRYLFQTGAQLQYFDFNAPGYAGAGIHVQVAGGVYILDVLGATAAQLQAQTQFF